MTLKQRVGDAFRFTAEDEAIAVDEWSVPERSLATGIEQPEGSVAQGCEKGFAVVVQRQLQPRPIVHRAAPEFFIRKNEPHGPDDVQRRSSGDAETRDVPSIGGDLRLEQSELEIVRRE